MVDLEFYEDSLTDFERYKSELTLKEVYGRIQSTAKVIMVGGNRQRKLANCFTIEVEDDLVPKRDLTEHIQWGVYLSHPFQIVDREWLQSNDWLSFEYELFDDYQKAVKEMLINSYHYYKGQEMNDMAQAYIDCIEDHKEEHPHLWI